MTLDIGVLGCGTIGTELARAVARGDAGDARIDRVCDHTNETAALLAEIVGGAEVVSDYRGLTDGTDLVVEAAGQGAVAEAAVGVLEAGIDLMIMSVGALGEDDLREAVLSAAEGGGANLYAPSGALAGLDAVKAAAVAGSIESVSLTTRKPPSGLEGAPYIEEHDIDLEAMEVEEVVFEGHAAEAAAAFPSNINVAMALTLAAGVHPTETTVRIVADPEEENNVHQVHVSGGAGTIETAVHNVPSPSNPKTSYLAALSAIEKLRGLTAPVKVGT